MSVSYKESDEDTYRNLSYPKAGKRPAEVFESPSISVFSSSLLPKPPKLLKHKYITPMWTPGNSDRAYFVKKAFMPLDTLWRFGEIFVYLLVYPPIAWPDFRMVLKMYFCNVGSFDAAKHR